MTNTGRGLAPFDEPVYLEQPIDSTVAIEAPADERSRPVLAFVCRSSLVASLAAAIPFLTSEDLRLVVGVLVLVHLPLAAALDVARAGGGRVRPALSYALTSLDVALLTALAAVSSRGILLSTLGPLLIAFHRWLYGRRAAALSVVLVTGSLAVVATSAVEDVEWFTVFAVGAVGSLLVWLVDDQAIRHSQANAGLQIMANRAEAVLEGIGDGIVSTTADGRVVGLNPAAADLLGCRPADTRGLRCHVVLGLETDGGRLDCEDGCALVGRDGASVEVRRKGPHGSRQPLLASAVALRDQDGAVIEVVHLLRDITTIKAADEAKTLFLATASHELKTPLAVISGYAQLLRLDTIHGSERATAIDAIESRSAQLVHIVDRLLMSSRIDAGRIDLLLRPIPIEVLLRDHAVAFSRSTRQVDLVIPEPLPHALTDYAALETIVDHLLDNANKYAPHDASVSVRAHADDDHVHIEVRDSGIGMTQAQMDHCFERFWQAEGTDVRRFGGTGIGLYIVQSLVHAMHGEIAVRANDGRGVTFTTSLRRHPLEIELDLVEPSSSDRRPTDRADGEASMIREFMRQVGVLPASEDAR